MHILSSALSLYIIEIMKFNNVACKIDSQDFLSQYVYLKLFKTNKLTFYIRKLHTLREGCNFPVSEPVRTSFTFNHPPQNERVIISG